MEVSSESEEDTSEQDTIMLEAAAMLGVCQIERVRVKRNDWWRLAKTKYSRENY